MKWMLIGMGCAFTASGNWIGALGSFGLAYVLALGQHRGWIERD
jgi:hypothetical protein